MSPNTPAPATQHLRRFLLRRAFRAIALMLLGVTLLGQGIELLDRSSALSRSGLSLWAWNLERLPLLFGLLAPVGAGLGGALYAGLLRLRGEYTALRVLGMPPLRILWTPFPLLALLLVGQTLCLEWGRPRADAARSSLREDPKASVEMLWQVPPPGPLVLIRLTDPGAPGCWDHTQLTPLNAQGLPSARVAFHGLCPTAHGWTAQTQTLEWSRLEWSRLEWSRQASPLEWLEMLPPPQALPLLRRSSAEGLSSVQVVTLLQVLDPGNALCASLRRTLWRRLGELLLTPVLWGLCTAVGLAGDAEVRLGTTLARALGVIACVSGLLYAWGR